MSGKKKLIKDIIDVVNVHLAGESLINIRKFIKKVIKKELISVPIYKIEIKETDEIIEINTIHANGYEIEENKTIKIIEILDKKFKEMEEKRLFTPYYTTLDEYHKAINLFRNNKPKTKLSETEIKKVVKKILKKEFKFYPFSELAIYEDEDFYDNKILKIWVGFPDKYIDEIDSIDMADSTKCIHEKLMEIGEERFPVIYYLSESEFTMKYGRTKNE